MDFHLNEIPVPLNKILVPMDGSDHALKAVRYISDIPTFQKMKVVLFHVYYKPHEHYRDLEKNLEFDHRMIKEINELEKRQEMSVLRYMENARQVLMDAGFSSDNIKIKTNTEEKGVARDIIREAKYNYSAVVVGRKGISDLDSLVLGSVSIKLIEKLDFTPLLVVGKCPKPDKILLAVDGSDGAMRAVDYVGTTLGGSDFEVTLAHVIRGGETLNSGYRLLVPLKEYIKEAKEEITAYFDEAKNRLINSGFEPNQVSTKIITGVYSRAVAIFEEAKDGGYGTIVVGRRGLSKVREFFMGRVSNKLIQLGRKHAVWVVN